MKFAERLRPLKIDAFIGQEFIVEVVFDFLHFGGNVDFVDELNRKIATGQAQACRGRPTVQ